MQEFVLERVFPHVLSKKSSLQWTFLPDWVDLTLFDLKQVIYTVYTYIRILKVYRV